MLKKLFSLLIFLFLVFSLTVFAQDNIPDYSQTPRKDIPEEFTWNTRNLYPTETEWETDKEMVKQQINRIPEMAKDWTSSAAKMMEMYNLITDITIKLGKLYAYASHNGASDLSNTNYQKLKGDIQVIYVDLGTKLAFMNNDIISLGENKFNEYLTSEPGLKDYKFRISNIFREKNHILPEDQQRIVSLTGLFSNAFSKAAKMLNDVEIPNPEVTLSNGKKVTLSYVNYALHRSSKDASDRSLVMRTFWENHKKFENTFAILLDAEMKSQYFSAKTRKFNTCLQARLFGNNIDTMVYLNMVKTVRDNLGSLHKYLVLKKELLGLDTYRYEDLYASAVKSVEKKYTYDEAKKILLEAMKPLGDDYVDILKTAFANRWIDIYPNLNKESGAYSSGVYGVHPFIKLNYDGEYDGVTTAAHELGHAVHSYLSYKTQPYPEAQYPTFLAEVASTFNENLLMEYLLEYEKDDLFKLFILDNYLEQVRATIFRQTLFAEFELEMHRQVEQGKTLTADWLSNKYLELTRYYYGHEKGITEVDDYIQNEWSVIPHFYLNFYVFQYSTGLMASMALSDMVLNGKEKERKQYIEFLSSGGNDFPIEILKKAGIDMSDTQSYVKALNRFSKLVNDMEKLVVKLKSEGKL